MNLSQEIIERLAEKYSIEIADDYGEDGYSLEDGKQGIMLSNWNDVPKHVQSRLEKDFELEWNDEWITDYSRNEIYRTSPDSYGWKACYVFFEEFNGEILTKKEAEDNCTEEYLQCLVNDPNRADIFDILDKNTSEELHGFLPLDLDFEAGFYGTNDNPAEILEGLLKEDPNGEFIFGDLSVEQFRTTFTVYKRIQEEKNNEE